MLNINKKPSVTWIMGVLLLGTFSSAGFAAKQQQACDVKAHKSLVYGKADTTAGSKTLFLDLYEPIGAHKPCNKKKRPVMLLIHGGGFTSGTRKQPELVDIANDFVTAGYVVASIDYRLLKKHSLPVLSENGQKVSEAIAAVNPPVSELEITGAAAATMDSYTAIRWLKKNKRRYDIKMAKMVIAGGSAGAITALNTAYLLPKLGIYKRVAKPKAVIDLWGAYVRIDLLDSHTPPTFIVHGTNDKTVPFAYSAALVEQMNTLEIYNEFYPVRGAGHSFDDIPVSTLEVEGITLQQRMLLFADKVLGR